MLGNYEVCIILRNAFAIICVTYHVRIFTNYDNLAETF